MPLITLSHVKDVTGEFPDFRISIIEESLDMPDSVRIIQKTLTSLLYRLRAQGALTTCYGVCIQRWLRARIVDKESKIRLLTRRLSTTDLLC